MAPLTLVLAAVAPFHPPAVAEEVIAVAFVAAEEAVGAVIFVEAEVVISVAAEEAAEAAIFAEAEEVVISVEAEAAEAAAVVEEMMTKTKYTR